jgi:acyl-CoA thioesterase-2
MNEIEDLPSVLALHELSERSYRVDNHGDPDVHNVVFGGQLLAQMIMAATRHSPGMSVKTINAIFARAGRVDAETTIDVETIHSGRAFASHTITVRQGDRLCSRALVLAHAEQDDLISHQPDAPDLVPPADGDPAIFTGGLAFPGAEHMVDGGVDTTDSSLPARPAELDVWLRSTITPDDPTVNQAVLAWATDGFLIGTAMLPHIGFGQDRAHRDLSTGVLNHTLTFHRPFSLADWALMRHDSPFAGGGRSHGRCLVFDRAGSLVASYVQDNMIRPMPEGTQTAGM